MSTSVNTVPEVSIVLVAYNMARELPRTLWSLSPSYQRGMRDRRYEIVLMDNGSAMPFDLGELTAEFRNLIRYQYLQDAPPSPAAAVNQGIEMARAKFIGVMIDGARIASPGLLRHACSLAGIHPRPIVSTLGFHLGPDVQMHSIHQGYNQEVEDLLLERSRWLEDGYNLFSIAALAGSSASGWFLPIAESNALFLTREMWQELGGMDERFQSPGGGLVNLDTYYRACHLRESQLFVLLGEGTFHQLHGGVATNATTSDAVQSFWQEYTQLHGRNFSAPEVSTLYFGSLPPQCLELLAFSANAALAHLNREPRVVSLK